MIARQRLISKSILQQVHHLPSLILIVTIVLALIPGQTHAQAIEVVVEDPELHPGYTTCPQTYWYPFQNNHGHTAYLTLNTNNRDHSTNYAHWQPLIPQAGYYRVEAYIAFHDPIKWCNNAQLPIAHDTTEARYTIHHFYGDSQRSLSQYPLNNQWLNLGEYYFASGSTGYVSLTDFNAEAEYTTSVSFSAVRFTFTRLSRPQVFLPLLHYSDPAGSPPPDVGIIQGQGFDACYLPSLSKMQTWWNASPYSFFGLYLGGIHFASFCTKADASWVQAAHAQGWSFIPTWVGPQAPCSGYKHVISYDLAVAYQQGRYEAQAASAAAATVGLTNYGLGGTVIYYDMETFGGASPECRQAAAAFMNGWTERLGELGNLAGGYGARSSYVTDWADVEHVPQDVWAASWYADGYDPYASVNGISWLVGLWTNHQRIRQYAGDVSNTWGGVSLAIDINVADGMVAMPPSKSIGNTVGKNSPLIEDTGWLSSDRGWLVMGNRLFITQDQAASWQDVSPAPVQLAYILPSGEAWAVSTATQASYTLYHRSELGQSWNTSEILLPPDAWKPLQLHFDSAMDGWIVFKKATSQVFSSGILLKTTDAGSSWQAYDLPVGEKITFLSPESAWQLDQHNGLLYVSSDAGATWSLDTSSKSPHQVSQYPLGVTTSGWVNADLGWSVTMSGSCSGPKGILAPSCQTENSVWLTIDGGQDWEKISLPVLASPDR